MGTKGGIGNDQNHTEDCHPGRMDDHGTPPPSKMGRDQLARAVVHHLYETALGGLDRMIEQNLHNWRRGLYSEAVLQGLEAFVQTIR